MEGDRTIEVKLKLSPLQAVKFINTMRHVSDQCTITEECDFWRGVANDTAALCVGLSLNRRHRVIRPDDDDEVMVQRVLDGTGVPPVLSRTDAMRVIAKLADRRTARQLGQLLYMDMRTVARLRAAYRRGEWKKYGIE